ncbi:MAG: peptide deformylase [Epsilonproteobacteria bacterium]|nr:peptide deformylase [Campylobacterota bacterium]
MVHELVVYPDNRLVPCGDVRGFDESVIRLVDDMIDTMKANNLDALSAIQIARPFNVIVVKLKNGEYKEYINLRFLSKKERFENIETNSYFPGVELKIPRYKKVKIYYQDKFGKEYYEDIDDSELAATLQRKMDFLCGTTPLIWTKKEYREKILDDLSKKGLKPNLDEVCPIYSKKDYIRSFTDKIIFFMALFLFTPLFEKLFDLKIDTIKGIYSFEKYGYIGVIILMIIYFVYAQYEAKKYRQCSSCQIGNQIGIIFKRVIASTLIFAASVALFKLYYKF